MVMCYLYLIILVLCWSQTENVSVMAFSVPSRSVTVLRRTSGSSLRGGEEEVLLNGSNNNQNNNNDTTILSSNSRSTAAPNSDAYYLLGSPGFVPKLLLTTIFLVTMSRILSRWDISTKVFGVLATNTHRSIHTSNRGRMFISNILLPLLSSSCCAIQLLVNIFSTIMSAGAGCLGFNTVLGPLRPFLLALMIVYTTSATPPTIILLRYAIAFLPEFVFIWNELLRRSSSRLWMSWGKKKEEKSIKAPTTATTDGVSIINDTIMKATVIVEIPTMGCVACINKIESCLRQCASSTAIESAKSFLNPTITTSSTTSTNSKDKNKKKKGGYAQITVRAASKNELDDLVLQFITAIDSAGFKNSRIQNVDIRNYS